jgi:hypothetical protein
MSNSSQKIIVQNTDGSTGQVTVDNTGALKVNGTVTAQISPDTPVSVCDGTITTQKLAVDASGKIGINILPSVTVGADSVGLAKEAGGNLAAIKADTDKIPSKGTAAMAGSAPVTIATDDTLVSAIKTDVDKIPSKGTAAMAGSTPVTIATDDTLMVAIKTDLDRIPSSPAQESGNLASIKTDVDKIPSKGSSTMAGSTPVTIATDDTVMLAIKGVPSLLNTPSAYTSTASYASAISGPLVITRGYKRITVNIKENNVNAVMYQIVGYTEASGFTRPIVLATALDVAKNGGDYQIVEMPLLAIDVQAVDKVGGTHGLVTVDVVLG